MDMKRIKALNSGESARLNKVTQNLDKQKNNLEKELIDIQRARRIFEARKKSYIVPTNRVKQNKTQGIIKDDNQDLTDEAAAKLEAADLNNNYPQNDDTKILDGRSSTKIDPNQPPIHVRRRKSSKSDPQQLSTSSVKTDGQKEVLENRVQAKKENDLILCTNLGNSLCDNEEARAVPPVSFKESDDIADAFCEKDATLVANRRPLRRSVGSGGNTFARTSSSGSLSDHFTQSSIKPLCKSLSSGKESTTPNSNESLPNIENTRRQRRISLPDNHKFTATRTRRNSGKCVTTLEEISEGDSSIAHPTKDFLRLPGITQAKSKSDSDLSNGNQLESLSSYGKKYGKWDGVDPCRKDRRLSLDYNNNCPVTVPEIVCHHAVYDSNENTLQSSFKRRKALSLIDLERASNSEEQLDHKLVGRFRRIGAGSMAENFVRSKRLQSYNDINRTEGEPLGNSDAIPAQHRSIMGNQLSLPRRMLLDRWSNERPRSWNGPDSSGSLT